MSAWRLWQGFEDCFLVQVVDAITAWTGGFAALSSFGFGGSNVHMLLHGRPRSRSVISLTANDASFVPMSPRPSAAEPQPTGPDAIGNMIPLAARTSEGMAALISAIQASTDHSCLLLINLEQAYVVEPSFIQLQTNNEYPDTIPPFNRHTGT